MSVSNTISTLRKSPDYDRKAYLLPSIFPFVLYNIRGEKNYAFHTFFVSNYCIFHIKYVSLQKISVIPKIGIYYLFIMKKQQLVKAIFVVLIFICAKATYAQKPLLYGVQNGLASTQITDINIDSDNFLWVATRSGLSRFDGQAFSNFISDNSNPFMLRTNHTTCTYQDQNGNLWVGSNFGLYHLDHSSNRFTQVKLDRDELRAVHISSIVPIEGKPNLMLIGTNGYGLYVFNTDTFTTEDALTEKYNEALEESYIPAIQNDNYGNHWIAGTQWFKVINSKTITLVDVETSISPEERRSVVIQGHAVEPNGTMLYFGTVSHGIMQCNTLSHKIEFLDIPEFKNKEMYSLYADKGNTLLVGTEGSGLWSLDTKNLNVERMRFAQCPIDLDYAKIHNIIRDKQGNTWLSIYQKGILEVPNSGRLFNCLPVKATQESEHNLSNVSCFSERSDARIYGLDGAGFIVEHTDGSLSHFSTENSVLNSNAIMSLRTVENDVTFVGTYNHGLFVLDKSFKLMREPKLAMLDGESIMCMAYKKDRKELYIGTNGLGVFVYNLESKELNQLVVDDGIRWIVSLYADNKNNLWIGIEGSLKRFVFDKGIDEKFDVPGGIRVFNIQQDSKKSIWFLADKGLYKYDYEEQTLSNIRLNTQLGEVYATMCISDDDQIWIASNFGITNYDPEKFKSLRYNSPDIAEIGSFSIRAAKKWSTGSIAFGGDNGMLLFKAEDVENFDYKLSPIYFTRLWVNNVITDYDPQIPREENVLDRALWCASEMRLPISSNSFSLAFTVQEFSTPVDIYYSYRLNGFEDTWHEVQGVNQNLSYSSLPAGKYTLTVTAHQGNDPNSEPQTKDLIIIIYQPWYNTWWAYLIYALLFAGIVAAITAIVSRRRQKLAALKELRNGTETETVEEEVEDDDEYEYDDDDDDD